jgi:hypothetical protein
MTLDVTSQKGWDVGIDGGAFNDRIAPIPL